MKKKILLASAMVLALAFPCNAKNPYSKQAFSACVYGWSIVWLDNQQYPGIMKWDELEEIEL
jgi:hypothetical protein